MDIRKWSKGESVYEKEKRREKWGLVERSKQ